jgi:hypothetical protein
MDFLVESKGGIRIISLIIKESLNDYFVEMIKRLNMTIELNIFKPVEFSKEVIRISQKYSKYLIIDYDLILDRDFFIEELKQLRVVSSETVVLIIASGLKPGDIFLKKIVNLGVYNIIISSNPQEIIDESIEILQKPRVYRDAVQYDFELKHSTQKRDKEERISVHHVGTKIIGMISGQKGVGGTHTLMMLAHHLQLNHSVAIIEMNQTEAFLKFGQVNHHLTNEENNFKFKGVHYFFDVELSTFLNDYKNRYEYILLDFGNYQKINRLDYFFMSDIKLCMLSGIDWHLIESKEIYEGLKTMDYKRNWLYLVPFIEKKYLKEMNVWMENELISIPFNVNPFKPEKKVKSIFNKMLKATRKANVFKKMWKGVIHGLW